MVPAVLEAWHTGTLQTEPGGIVAKAGDAEIRLDRKRLGDCTGRIGLVAGNNSQGPQTVELRAFAAK